MRRPSSTVLDKAALVGDFRANDGNSLEEHRQVLRNQAKSHFWWFSHVVCEMRDIDNALHRKLCHIWQMRRKCPFAAYLLPREHLKTSVLTICGSLFEAINNPNVRIMIGSATLDMSKDMLREIKKGPIESSEMFRWLFPEYCYDLASKRLREKCAYKEDAIDYPARTVWKKESNIMITGSNHSLTSKHFEILDFDDIADDKNVATRLLRDKLYRWFLNCWQLRHKMERAHIRYKATRWHDDDPIGREIIKEKKLRKSQKLAGKPVKPFLKLYQRSVLEESVDEEGNVVESSIWPERFSIDALHELKNRTDPYIWSCQWMNQPVNSEDAIFDIKQVKRIREATILGTKLKSYMAVDLAMSDNQQGDYTVVTVVSFDMLGRMIVRYVFRIQTKNLERIFSEIVRLQQIYSCTKVVVETTAFQQVVLDNFKKWAWQKRIVMPWYEIRHRAKNKLSRWISIQGIVNRGDFYCVMGLSNYDALINEMATLTPTHFPANDDILDTLADCFAVATIRRGGFSGDGDEEKDLCAGKVFDLLYGPMSGTSANLHGNMIG